MVLVEANVVNDFIRKAALGSLNEGSMVNNG